MDSHGLLPTASQTKQGQALGRSWCTCNADPSPYNPTPGLASPAHRIGLGARCGRPAPWTGALAKGIPLRITGWKTLRAAGARVAAPHFCPPFQHFCFPPEFPKGHTLPHPRTSGGGTGGTPFPCSEGFKNHRKEFLSRQVLPPPTEPPRRYRQVSGAGLGHTPGPASPAGAAVAVFQAAPPLGAVLPAGGSGGRRPMGGAGRRAGLAPAPALPRPGRRARSVGAARPAHLAGSHPSARRGARWERAPGRRGRAALTRRTAEAPARRRVCVCGEGRRRPIDTHFAGRAAPPRSRRGGWAGARTEGREGGRVCRWDAGAQLRCGRTAVALGNARPGGARRRGEWRAGAGARARAPGPRLAGVGGGARGAPGSGGSARAGGRGADAEAGAGGRGRGPGGAHACGPTPPGRAGRVRAHARCAPAASVCGARARAARRRTCEVSLEESEREGGWVRGARGLGRLSPSLGVSSRAAGLQPLPFFSGPRRGCGGEGERARGGEGDECVKEKENNPSLGVGLGPAGAGAWAGRVGAARASGRPAAPGQAAPRAAWPRASASRRGPAVPGAGRGGSQMAAGCAAPAGQRRGRGPAGPRGSRTPEPGSIVVAAGGRGSSPASGAREAAPWSLSRRVPGEAVMAAPWERGVGAAAKPRCMHGALLCVSERLAPRRSPTSILRR